MTLISKRLLNSIATALIVCGLWFFSFGTPTAAAQGVALSLTPTLVEMTADPGRSWESSLKIINNNAFPLTVYAEVVNFVPQGEEGQGMFVPLRAEERDGNTIAEWLQVTADPIVIPRESSVDLPVSLSVPVDAVPGGHYAAVLIGTRPPETETGQVVRTSQVVTSLFFTRIAGDVIESGTIRSFRAVDRFVGTPEATFELRFENRGNVHLRPQGEIVIKNMWGTERGTIPINRQTHFGNVLPKNPASPDADGVRRFEFTWNGAFSLPDIGRYTAEVTLAYGSEERQFTSYATSFYVIPLKALGLTILIVLAVVWFIRFAVRSYVRRMLVLAGVDPDLGRGVMVSAGKLPQSDVRITRVSRMAAPVHAGYLDLQARLTSVYALSGKLLALGSFVVAYRRFFISVLGFGFILLLGIFIFKTVFNSDVPYEVTIDRDGTNVTLSSEQIIYDEQREASPLSEELVTAAAEQTYTLILTNASGRSGAGAALKRILEGKGYAVSELRSDLTGVKDRTILIFDPALQDEALALSRELGGALLSGAADAPNRGAITVLIGSDWLPTE